jgi:hypothetical protein
VRRGAGSTEPILKPNTKNEKRKPIENGTERKLNETGGKKGIRSGEVEHISSKAPRYIKFFGHVRVRPKSRSKSEINSDEQRIGTDLSYFFLRKTKVSELPFNRGKCARESSASFNQRQADFCVNSGINGQTSRKSKFCYARPV